MITNFFEPLDQRAIDILTSYHVAGCNEAGSDWDRYRVHSLRLQQLSSIAPGTRIALDRAEYELIETGLPA